MLFLKLKWKETAQSIEHCHMSKFSRENLGNRIISKILIFSRDDREMGLLLFVKRMTSSLAQELCIIQVLDFSNEDIK